MKIKSWRVGKKLNCYMNTARSTMTLAVTTTYPDMSKVTQQVIERIDQSINEEKAERYYKMMEEDPADLYGIPTDKAELEQMAQANANLAIIAGIDLKRGKEVAREREQAKHGNTLKYVCSNCGSENVGTVGVISWYADEQKWDVGCIYDDEAHAYCGDCEADNSKGSRIRLLPVLG